MIHARLDGAARTIVLTLRARADEQDQPTPLFYDPWSVQWLEHLPRYEDYERWYNPTFQLATVVRTRLIDDAVAAFLETHDNPLVVEFGAGFSTRYYRVGEGRTRWIDSDLEQAIVVRRKLDVERDNHWFLPADLRDASWMEQLPDEGAENVLFIAEGVLMFTDEATVSRLFRLLGDSFPGARFIFDVVNPGYIARVSDTFNRLQAPMQWGVREDDLPAYGLDVVQTDYLLLEYPQRWEEIGVTADKRRRERSGYIVDAVLTG